MKNIETKKRLVKRIVLELHPDKHKEVKTAAAFTGMTIKDFVDKAIAEFIKREKNE